MSNVRQHDIDRIVARTKACADAVCAALHDGNEEAINVVRQYRFFSRCPEAMSYLLLEEALNAWEDAR